MNPTETKPALKSLGIVGPLLGAGVLLLNQFVFKAEVVLPTDATALIDIASIGYGTITGIIGRFRARKPIAGPLFQKRA
jgi:hypothetical protein